MYKIMNNLIHRSYFFIFRRKLPGKYLGHTSSLAKGIDKLKSSTAKSGFFVTVSAPKITISTIDAPLTRLFQELSKLPYEISMYYIENKKEWILIKGFDKTTFGPGQIEKLFDRNIRIGTFIHNHPDSTPFPSGVDLQLASIFKINTNIIVGKTGYVHFDPSKLAGSPGEDYRAFGFGEKGIRALGEAMHLTSHEADLLVSAMVIEKGRDKVDPASPKLASIMDKIGVSYQYYPFSTVSGSNTN